ncbi:hypothetical protein [Methylocystis parvus]|uniref:O-antigen ligase family protein n=1 Tax=Methylocystis parvus TaxID=134 RepID=A0A6B8MCQ1_9HYPH|nr:hypothetical protein [Methylocystis parvus]QGM99093.1 hypothetical protein F7D14_17440 [Methylocystis parvus]WBK00538.1 hypothetical protein MMG94_02100 [Methylocystis parvus OBBP]
MVRSAWAEAPRGLGGLEVWPQLLQAFATAIIVTVAPIALHFVSQPIAIVFCAFGALFVSRFMPRDVPVVVLISNIFQNTVAALFSYSVEEYADIEVLKSYSFLTTAVCWLYMAISFAHKPSAYSPFVRKLIYASVGLLAIVGVYFVLGLAVNPRNATVYLRNIGLPIFLFQMFLLLGAKQQIDLPKILLVILLAVGFCGYFELFSLDGWLTVTNGWRYLTLFTAKRLVNVDDIRKAAEGGMVITSVLDYSKSDLFNTPLTSSLGLHVQRLQGPGFNTISFAYMLSSLIALLAIHRRGLLALLAMPLLLATSAKGPLIFTVLCVGFYYVARRSSTNLPVKGLALFLIAYAILVIKIGSGTGDFHVLGLLGGLNGFLKMPIGHTLGDGGNLSIVDFGSLKWEEFQAAGAANVAVESAFGVLLYQLGVAAAAWFAFYFWVAAVAWRLYKQTRAPALSFVTSGILASVTNGLFQEEAYFVPFSLAFVMGYCGLILGATDRAVLIRFARSEMSPAAQPPSNAWTTPRSIVRSSLRRPKLVE